jgi:activator of HSP90 ATPase
MTIKANPTGSAKSLTRRQAISGMAIALGSLATGSKVFGQTASPAMKATPGTVANQMRTSLHQEMAFKADPSRLYEALLEPKQFAAFTGSPAEIDPKEGGFFSMFGGRIIGRNVELVPNQRIVQAWRPAHWNPGIYSIVKFELKPQGSETLLVLDHTGFPEGQCDHLGDGWKLHYYEPLKKFLV